MFQGFVASDLHNKTVKEKKEALVSRIKDLLARRKKTKLKGKSVEGIEGQIEALRERLRRLKKGE